MTRTGTAQELAAPLGSVEVGRLVFSRGASHLTIGVDGSMEDLYRARFEGKMPYVSVAGGTVTVAYRMSLRPPTGRSFCPAGSRGRSGPGWGCRTS
jgi:hypothetical protein